MSLDNNLLYTRIYYQIWDRSDYQLKGPMIDQLDTRLLDRVKRHFIFQPGCGLGSDLYNQLKEDHAGY